MRRRRELATMRKIVEVRDLQRLAAEMRAARAAEALTALDEKRAEGERRLDTEQARWAEWVGRPSLDLQMTNALSSLVLAEQDGLQRLDGEIAEAQEVKTTAAEDWMQASARLETAEDLTKAAARRVRRWREEAALVEAHDRFAQRKAMS